MTQSGKVPPTLARMVCSGIGYDVSQQDEGSYSLGFWQNIKTMLSFLLEFVSTAADGFLSPNGESLPENEATSWKIETKDEKAYFSPLIPPR